MNITPTFLPHASNRIINEKYIAILLLYVPGLNNGREVVVLLYLTKIAFSQHLIPINYFTIYSTKFVDSDWSMTSAY